MGNRAVIAYNNGSSIAVTQIQVSVAIDAMISRFIEMKRKKNDDFDFLDFSEKLFQSISRHRQIGYIGIVEDSNVPNLHSINIVDSVEDGDEFFHLYFIGDSEDALGSYQHGTDKDIYEVVKSHPHNQDGISMYYTKGDDKIHFHIDDSYLDEEGKFFNLKIMETLS